MTEIPTNLSEFKVNLGKLLLVIQTFNNELPVSDTSVHETRLIDIANKWCAGHTVQLIALAEVARHALAHLPGDHEHAALALACDLITSFSSLGDFIFGNAGSYIGDVIGESLSQPTLFESVMKMFAELGQELQ